MAEYSEYPEDLDYEKDVLKFKQIWNDIKKPTKADLQTIQEKPSNHKPKKSVPKSAKPTTKQPKKVTVISEAKIQRNPKEDPEQVIQIVTKPASTYQDKLRNQKNNEIKECLIFDNMTNPINNSVAELKRTIDERNYQLSMLRTSNTRNEDKIRYLQRQIQKRDETIAELRARQRQLIGQKSSLNSKQFNFNYGKVQYENFKNDTRRLLKMLQNTSEYSYFASFGLDDDGVRFLNEVNKTVKTKIDKPNTTNFHFCNCNKEFISQAGLWVPQKVHSFGKKFIKQRNNQLTQAQFQLLLYELNKIWRQREKRIINTVNASKAHEVDKFKRKIKNMEKAKSRGQLD